MPKTLIINSTTKVIESIITDYDDSYEVRHGREAVKGTGKVGEVFKPKPAKKAVKKSNG